ncbi:spore cortex biosynthesis protein YabQ [Thalassobacillus sp. CUG 92003]|uniref:spore cortex biosynthesis protein YabQ n=1 Tax=Thalassobacillus sp. CUG 92003 TaxID=2736641 RepID=UPI0015E6C658|nr:spore cortex biosynthesis protein YabQ [Thalassobacillus sp. CUG 92003]
MSLSVQFLTMVTMIASGIYLGAAVDTFHKLTKGYRKKVVLDYALVLSFWMFQALFLFLILYLSNYGELRFYILVAVICGYAAYRALFRARFLSVLEWVFRVVARIVSIVRQTIHILIIQPIVWIVRTIFYIVLWVLSLLGSGIIGILKLIYFLLTPLGKGVWWLLPKNMKKFLHHIAGFCGKIKNRLLTWWKSFKK